ncbi:glycosyltransferase family 2 protein [Metabacillus malikii]|uniref:Glycosyltransferase involved in cell wall biosynthesis n=1 Tax=Metabacillus malikii TaxID=1504265 RepID=A0ABT9ZGR0_9BACI|nr:glycosyltransferase family 2 protein [Metabacillus malikii]MDQ0231434.1 glycosyltransferase involved in cell wall biosynthesis [Metabacillus malikii]
MKVSVVIATYNGANYIQRQLDTVIKQLSENDQIIIVDDCSKDETVSVVKENYGDGVEVYVNEKNLGVIKSFEKAILLAGGDVIFLCDQDDVWEGNKVERMLKAFQDENASLVVHDATVVDGNLETLHPSWNEYNGNKKKGLIGNVIKNSFTGCCMAFKKDLVSEVTPFPNSIEMHDQWIALVCLKRKKKIVYINEPLIKYVRHGGNVTGVKKRSLSTKIKGRLGTISALTRDK